MSNESNKYITTQDLLFKGVLSDIKKSKVALQPLFEAFTNSLEAIKIRQIQETELKGKILISIRVKKLIDGNLEFDSISITDNGTGFNNTEFKRFNTFKDFTKGYKNLGSGRLQFAHYFDNTIIKSSYRENGSYYEREFVVSKKTSFLNQNAIVFHRHRNEISAIEPETVITFNTLLEKSNIYNTLNQNSLKLALLERYIPYFCNNRAFLPEIKIEFYENLALVGESSIDSNDIPSIDKSDKIKIKYSRISSDGKSVIYSDKKEEFVIDAFRIPANILKGNDLKFVSKGEVIEDDYITLNSLSNEDRINGHKFLFLVSGDYIDQRDTNVRGELNIPNKEIFLKNTNLFLQEEILIEDIQDDINGAINTIYPEINEVRQEHEKQLEELKKMFLLDDDAAKDLQISINDSETKILEKFYEAEAKKAAKVDASIKESLDRLNKMDTSSKDYAKVLKEEVDCLVKKIPLQNKLSLTHYVARRKLVLNLLGKILDNELDIQKSGSREMNEKLIHNLLFQQSSSSSLNSDLWIINEDFIYFKGSSEAQLFKLEVDGEKVFKTKFSEEEEKYLSSLGENRKIKRPDVLLFPAEGKCIIIEFKAPEVNASDHLMQIDFYANLIRNYSEDKFQITTFFGFLIGQNIEERDVLGRVGLYEHSYHFDYLFRPSVKVRGFDGRVDGSIYTEVLKYRTLLDRAKLRNNIFIEKLNNISSI